MPFTYIGYSIRKSVELRIKQYKGFGVKKYTTHAIISLIFLIVIEVLLYILLDNSRFYGVSFIFCMMILLGLFGIKLTFDLEGFITGIFDNSFKKD